MVSCIDGFHSNVIRLQSQKIAVLRILIYTRLKINGKWIFVQVSSPEAWFISKIQQFELPSFHIAWQQNRNAVSLKKVSPLDFQQFNHLKYEKVCLCARMLALVWKGRAFTEKVNSRCFCWFPTTKLSTNRASPYNVTDTESSVKVCEMFRQITQKLWATKTWDLDKLFIY